MCVAGVGYSMVVLTFIVAMYYNVIMVHVCCRCWLLHGCADTHRVRLLQRHHGVHYSLSIRVVHIDTTVGHVQPIVARLR